MSHREPSHGATLSIESAGDLGVEVDESLITRGTVATSNGCHEDTWIHGNGPRRDAGMGTRSIHAQWSL